MISPETRVQIRRYFFAEHWKIGTIAQALDVHPDTVRRAIEVERFQHAEPLRPSIVDPYLPFVREVLEQYPRLRATRIHQMIRDRGYPGSVEQLRRVVARLRPQPHEAFLRLQVFPAEQAQVDWAYFGSVMVGRARRQQHRAANRRDQRSREGRLDHRDRQRAYRQRHAPVRVTDQSSHSVISPALFGCGETILMPVAAPLPSKPPSGLEKRTDLWLRCSICGRPGRFVDPFPHIPRRR
ncbi:MAG TPA: hypothetical protein VK657_00455, partial [Terriglobales bacterium]|nr:hypothetical protein [Terriglobales bacterium]